jgi:glycosyltransferase involved in cell wall biosynthesis
VRFSLYQNFYRLFDSAIAISSLNREHLIGHGISSRNIEMSYYCVPNRFQYLHSKNKQNLRQKLRQQLGFNDEQTVILFSGKLISKKNPQLLLEAASIMPENKHRYLGLLYLGSGYLEASLKLMAESLGTCVGIISQPGNRSVEESDQPDGILSKRKSLRGRGLSKALPLLRVISKPDRSEGASFAPLQ